MSDPHVSRETQARLDLFVSLLLRWGRAINLIARDDAGFVWSRHILDSLQLGRLIPRDTPRAIDIGTGGGFPGLVLAIACGIQFDLIEADQRKAAFLREAIRVTAAPAAVHAIRAETARLRPAPVVTARALAPLPRLLTLAAPLLSRSGICLFLKGATVGSELTAAASQWHMQVDRIPSQTAQDACILRIRDIARVNDNIRS